MADVSKEDRDSVLAKWDKADIDQKVALWDEAVRVGIIGRPDSDGNQLAAIRERAECGKPKPGDESLFAKISRESKERPRPGPHPTRPSNDLEREW